MAGRIRTIKPEWLEDATSAGLSDRAARLMIAGVLLADDYGRMRAEPRWLHGQVWWARPEVTAEHATEALDELVSAKILALYEVTGQRYAVYRNWEKHQKVDHPGKPRCPAPPETLATVSRDPLDSLAPDRYQRPVPVPPTETTNTTGAVATSATAPEARARKRRGPEPVLLSNGATRAPEVAEVFGYWAERHPGDFLQVHSGLPEYQDVQRRLQDGCSVAQLKSAIDGIHLDDWPERPRNMLLKHVVKDLAAVQRFERMAQQPRDGPKLSEKERKSLAAAQSWAEKGMGNG